VNAGIGVIDVGADDVIAVGADEVIAWGAGRIDGSEGVAVVSTLSSRARFSGATEARSRAIGSGAAPAPAGA
jgi:hypothetical protein